MLGEDQKTHCKSPVPYYAFRLRRCGELKALGEGKHVHSHIKECGLSSHVYIGNLLVQMYGKCGDLIDAYSTFEGLLKKNVFSWNIMISMYVDHGHGRKAIGVFQQMLN